MKRGGSIDVTTNKNNTTLYVGVTQRLKARVHHNKTCPNLKALE
jgi:hypothetical protein